MTRIPLPGCCNCCREPVTSGQKSVLFEGPNLRYPQLGPDTALFHTRRSCRWDARMYDDCWAKAAPDRVQKFPGSYSGEALLRLIEATRGYDPCSAERAAATLCLTGGAHDGARMGAEAAEEITEVYYLEQVPPPRRPEPGVWYVHAGTCPCGAAGTGTMPGGDHLYRPKPAAVTRPVAPPRPRGEPGA